ncbi:sensor histidine kinase [Actinoplanes subtropicus]|uniref:sensor histidine kinase n=1 Tax=Actinoplanes subtropicus TaxID=543632 RepID=UPI00068C90CF|nr:histidine kinase [Actinoplanes subtropicus]
MSDGRDRLSRRDALLDAAWAAGLALTGLHYARQGVSRPPAGGHMIGGGPVAIMRPAHMIAAGPVVVLLAAAAMLPLALRRRYPLTVLWSVTVTTALLLGTNPDLVFAGCLALGTAIYSAAAYSPRRRATLASLPVAAGLLVVLFQHAALPDLPGAYVGLLALVPIAVAATGIRVRRRRATRANERRAREEAEATRAAVGEERARIARELHDVVTHHVGMMVIQAGAARMVLGTSPGEAEEAMLAVEATGRTALADLRDALGVLGDDDMAARLRPQPGLGSVPELVERVRDAGVRVDYRVIGEPRTVSAGIGLTAYRVAQEALTNAVKHAAGAEAAVTVEYQPHQVRIEVTDTGPGPGGAAGAGYGLAGLRERVVLHGGTFAAERRLTGGFQVRATLPLAAS